VLRARFVQIFQAKMRNPGKPLSDQQQRWFEFANAALAGEIEVQEETKPPPVFVSVKLAR
jgi:hypothetical protein